MIPFIISLAFVVGIVVASFLWRREVGLPGDDAKRPEDGKFPFVSREQVLDEKQAAMYRMLDRELGREFEVLAKVRVADIVDMKKRTERKEFYAKLIRPRSVDFLLCERQTLRPVLAMQLILEKDRDEHELTADIFKAAGIPYVPMPAKKAIAPSELAYMIRSTLKHKTPMDAEGIGTKV